MNVVDAEGTLDAEDAARPEAAAAVAVAVAAAALAPVPPLVLPPLTADDVLVQLRVVGVASSASREKERVIGAWEVVRPSACAEAEETAAECGGGGA